MKPARFDYYVPRSLEKAIGLFARFGADAKALAGGQSLMPLLNMRLARPRVLVDLNKVTKLAYVREEDGVIAVGAMARQSEVESSAKVEKLCPLLTEAVRLIAHPAIRNRGTIGGSISHSDPAAELPAVLSALKGKIMIRGPRGQREATPEKFFLTHLTSSLEPDELVTEVRFPVLPQGAGWAFEEVARRHGDFAIVGVAAYLTLESGKISDVQLALTGVAGVPVRAEAARPVLLGSEPTKEAFRAAADKVRQSIDPESDLHASKEYRRHLAGVLTVRALERAASRAKT